MCPSTLKALAAYSIGEFWIGKRKWLQASSLIELVLILALMIGALTVGVFFHGRIPKSSSRPKQ
jgi:hypothetical protein